MSNPVASITTDDAAEGQLPKHSSRRRRRSSTRSDHTNSPKDSKSSVRRRNLKSGRDPSNIGVPNLDDHKKEPRHGRKSRSSSPHRLQERAEARRKSKARSKAERSRSADRSLSKEPVRPKSETSLDASKKSLRQINIFNDDTNVGTHKQNKQRRGRRYSSTSNNMSSHSQEEMENELKQMINSMNGSGKLQTGPLKNGGLDATMNSKAESHKSGKSKKKKKKKVDTPDTPGTKSVRSTKEIESDPPMNRNGELAKQPKPSKSTKSSKSARSIKSKKKSKQDPNKPPRRSKKPKPPSSIDDRNGVAPSEPKKTKKKKSHRTSSKSPTPAKAALPLSSNHSTRRNKKECLPTKSNHSTALRSKKDLSSKSINVSSKSAATLKADNGTSNQPDTVERSKSMDMSPGNLKRHVSENEAIKSAKSEPQGDANRLKRARSLFGSVRNPNKATIGDGDDSDNECEIKDNSNKTGKNLLTWAKKKMASPKELSPGFRKKRGLRVGRKGQALGDDSDDDDRGLLMNAEERGGQMSMLNLMETDPKQKRMSTGVVSVGEDNTIEESNEFNIPRPTNGVHKAPKGNKRPSTVSEANTLRNSSVMDQNRPPIHQIIAAGEIVEEDDMSDIGEPGINMAPTAEGNAGEIVVTPDRNDIVYENKNHPGTIRLIHVLREIILEQQDDAEYSPEMYKIIKRRLKGKKFLLSTVHDGQQVWREASKSENVRFLKDQFNIEMRELGFGGADELLESHRRRNSLASTGSVRDNLLAKAIAECKWAQEIAKPQGDLAMMNIGIDAEEKLINLIEVAEAANFKTQPLKEELDMLGELAKQMMYVSIAPLYERLEVIEERMADYFDAENAHLDALETNSAGSSLRDRSMEKEGEIFEMTIEAGSYDESIDVFEEGDTTDDDLGQIDSNDEDYEERTYESDALDEEYDDEEYEEESDEESGTNVKEGEVLNCDNTDGDVSSVGESGIYDESDSDSDESELEDGEPSELPWADFDDDSEENSEDESEAEDTNHSTDDESDVSDEPKQKKSIFQGPNPKMKQFFDRLKHLFETRERIAECLASKDPSNKCRKIKPKTHSGGITKKDGSYKKDCQQKGTNNKVVKNLDDLYDAARTAYPDFKSIVQQLVDEISGLDYKKHIILPELKSRDRAWEKATAEYSDRDLGPPESWLYDICRASIVCYTVKQVSEVSKWLTSNSNVVQAKNRFSDPVFNGYRDLLYHVSIPYGDGKSHICEVQVHLKAIYDLNDQCGTIKHYDYFRSCFTNTWRSPEDALSDLEKMNKYTKIEGSFMKRLLKSEDPEQLLLFAEILRKNLEEYDRALELYRRVLGLQEEAHGIDNPEMAATYQRIGLVLGAMGDTDESLQNLLKALAIQESFLGDDHIEVADTYVEIGHMLCKRGDYSGAYTQYQRTQLIRENKLGKEAFLVIKSIQDIGMVLQKKGDFVESEKQYRKALAIQKDVLGDDHMDVATTRSYIGKTLCLYGDFEGAMVEDKQALSMREKSLGKNHRSTADSHTALGVLLFHKGDYKTSRWHHNKALKIRESMLGKDDGECAISHRHLGELLSYAEGDYAGAVKALKRAQEILEANYGRDNPVTAISYLDLGHIHLRHGKHQEALAEYRRAKVILESNLGQTHPDTAFAYMCTGNALNLAGEQEEALSMHRKALVVFESVLGNSHPRTAEGYQSTGDVFVASGNPELALPEHREALKIRKSVLRKDHPDVSESCSRIGKILLTGCDGEGNTEKRDPQRALEIFREALTITEARCGKNHPAAAAAHLDVALAMIELSSGDKKLLGKAEKALTATLEVLREVEPQGNGKKASKSYYLGFGDDAAITGKACVSLGRIRELKGDTVGARDMFVEGLERLNLVLGSDHPETLKIESKLLSFVAES